MIEYKNGRPFVTFMKVRSKTLLNEKELNDIKEFILKKHNQIVNKWTDFFVKGKRPSVEKINKKVSQRGFHYRNFFLKRGVFVKPRW